MGPRKLRRGFAVMDRDKVREIARKGGQAAHRKGTAHKWTETEAIEAGRKGGLARHRLNHNGHSVDLAPMVAAPTELVASTIVESQRETGGRME